MSTSTGHRSTPHAVGALLHAAAAYDWLVWLRTLGRESRLRGAMLGLARVQTGQHVLDIGCGTGTLAIAAAHRVGPTGSVCALDASEAMIRRARGKAQRAGVEVTCLVSPAQAMPIASAQFDRVLSTLMLHHLPRAARRSCAQEMRRALKPDGLALAIDFGPATHPHRHRTPLHAHGHTSLDELTALLTDSKFTLVESGAVGYLGLIFVLATPK